MWVQVCPTHDSSSSNLGLGGTCSSLARLWQQEDQWSCEMPRETQAQTWQVVTSTSVPGVRWLSQCPTWAEKNCKVMLQRQGPHQSAVFSLHPSVDGRVSAEGGKPLFPQGGLYRCSGSKLNQPGNFTTEWDYLMRPTPMPTSRLQPAQPHPQELWSSWNRPEHPWVLYWEVSFLLGRAGVCILCGRQASFWQEPRDPW